MRISEKQTFHLTSPEDQEVDHAGSPGMWLWLPGTLNNRVNVYGEGRESDHVEKMEENGSKDMRVTETKGDGQGEVRSRRRQR